MAKPLKTLFTNLWMSADACAYPKGTFQNLNFPIGVTKAAFFLDSLDNAMW